MIDVNLNTNLHKVEIGTSTLFWADCFDVFPSIPDKSVDAIIADLPYGTTACKWDSILPLDKLWEQYKRIIKDNGSIILTASQPFTSALVMSNVQMFKYEWIWDKVSHTNPFIAKYRCLSVHENILVFSNGKTTYNPQKYYNGVVRNDKGKNGKRLGELFINNDVGYTRNMDGYANPKSILTVKRESISGSNEERSKTSLHPTQKPVELMEYLIKTYTNENEIVLDNTMGSGTTGIAALNTNRQFIGIEKEKEYYDITVERISSKNINNIFW
jgi:site-specific DNA-methyltransferase (adenine-specific)